MLSILAELTLRGSLLTGLVWTLERLFATRIQAQSRRPWWAIAVVAFLLPLRLPVRHLGTAVPARVQNAFSILEQPELRMAQDVSRSAAPATGRPLAGYLLWAWLAGASISLSVVAFQTVRTGRRWSREEPCANPGLLALLEECKASASVTAPIGLVLSESVSAPAILGWWRPRILMPKALATSLPRPQLRAVMLHELAHYRALDQPLHWLFTLARVIHWFNPIVHMAARQWLHFRELAADEAALRWLAPQERPEYSQALVEALKHAHHSPAPYGALALGETLQNLKQRITMISHHSSLARRGLFALTVSLFLATAVFVKPVWADQASDGKTAAVAAAESWLKVIDDGHYDLSWENASPDFKKGMTREQWHDASMHVRDPLGKCLSRKFTYARYHSPLKFPNGKTVEGEFVTLHFESSFEHSEATTEMLYFSKDSDGAWKAQGYMILND
jgi:beta-lactamase regulating signal transducer with metallopeptidase domain